MSLFRGTIRPPAILSDQAIERYLAEIRPELTPDPLFRRRLRGIVMNRYVAGREGIVAAPRHRSMGRLGRAVLYASFTLALSATTVFAASQQALPGDPLYALKRQVEELRVHVLPAEMHDDLAAYALAERIDELGRLAKRGDLVLVQSLANTVERDFAAFVAGAAGDRGGSSEKYLTVLHGLLVRLPDPAREAVQAVIDRADVPGPALPERGRRGGGTPATGDRGDTVGPPAGTSGSTGTPDDPPRITPEPRPSKSPMPDPAPRQSREPADPYSNSSDGSHGVDRPDD